MSYTVDFDTGSSDLFVPSTSCGQTCSGHTQYNSSASLTSQDLKYTFTLTYADGSTVNGKEYTDVVTVAGLTVREAVLPFHFPTKHPHILPQADSQTLGAATQYSIGFTSAYFPPDGLMGMAFESISVYDASPTFQSLIDQGQVDSPMFGVKLATSGSELFLGGVNPKYNKDTDFTWVTLPSEVCHITSSVVRESCV